MGKFHNQILNLSRLFKMIDHLVGDESESRPTKPQQHASVGQYCLGLLRDKILNSDIPLFNKLVLQR